MSRICILGGTFNPIHNAHLAIADAALEQAGVDAVWFMPSKKPPHKPGQIIASEEHRCAMIRMAIRANYRFFFSDYELQHDGVTYTAETLTRLREDYKEDNFCFLVGADSFFQLEKWFHPEIILQHAQLLAVPRAGEETNQMNHHAQYLRRHYGADIILLHMEEMKVSSSQIRDDIRKGIPVRGMLPECVENYIRENNLYLGEG